MSLLIPLGLLGLTGIAVLILIYILKPNYQQKFVSSTYVWKLSLKYRKKKIPVSRLRNILILICQILIIVACALILAKPVIAAEEEVVNSEKIIVVDASANMLAEHGGQSRFDRAKEQIKALCEEVIEQNGVVSVIVAGQEASFAVQRYGADLEETIFESVESMSCTYGTADIEGAMDLAETVLSENPDCDVLLYTATNYIYKGNVTVVDVSEEGEWNAAILNAVSVYEDNFYSFSVDVACYGKDTDLNLYCDVYGANASVTNPNGVMVSMQLPVRCDGDESQTVVFNSENSATPVYSYDYVYVHFDEADSYTYDNRFYIYGGTQQTIKILYYSTLRNNYFSGILMDIRDQMRGIWDIEITEIDSGDPELEDYDFYIFEHAMPEKMPTDGVVLLVDPDKIPSGLQGVTLGDAVTGDFLLAAGASHPITDISIFNTENISVTRYNRITRSDGFETLMYCAGDPMLLIKEDGVEKVVILDVDLNYSNLPLLLEFPVLMFKMFDYFFPSTLTGYSYEVNETVSLNSRGPVLSVKGTGVDESFDEFPAEISFSAPGVYTFYQTPLSGKEIAESIYVRIPSSESNILREVDVLTTPYIEKRIEAEDYDLLIYFAAALVALLFIEWLLQARENF